MDRRKAIKNLAIVSGGLITLPQWMVSCGISDTTIHQTSFSVAEQKILQVLLILLFLQAIQSVHYQLALISFSKTD